MSSFWKEMSYNRFSDRKYELDYNIDLYINDNCYRYGLYENITYKNTFSVDELFYYNEKE